MAAEDYFNDYYEDSDTVNEFRKTIKKGTKQMRIDKKFYVGSDRMSPHWPKKTLEQAISHAKEILSNDPTKDSVNIVKIIKVVRRRELPLFVEDVK